MKKPFISYFAAAAVVTLSMSGQAYAEVSALDVWNSWKSYAESVGQTISVGSQETDGGALILHNVTMSAQMPDGSFSTTMELLEFRERGDGTVAVTMSPDLPLSMTGAPPEGGAMDLAMILRQTGMSIIASGDPDDISFDFLAARLEFTVDKLVVDGTDVDPTVRVALDDVDGKYRLTRGDRRDYNSEFRAGTLSYDIAVTDPEKGGTFTASGEMTGFETRSLASIAAGFDMASPTAMFDGSANVEASFSTGPSHASVRIVDQKDDLSINTRTDSNALNIALVDGTMEYGGSATGIRYELTSPKIPFPEVALELADLGFRFAMPMRKTDEARDFGFLMRLGGLKISDMIWSMLDPQQVMPRDPATIELDVSGTMKWLVDITDPAKTEGFAGPTPAELYDVKINNIVLSAVGAEITGGGGFTFDNADMTTFKGMPAPTGAIDLRIVGVNGLIDRLIRMGMLPDDQAMGFRMMLGLFARPADGEDTMTSKIEVRGDGSVFANGQQLK